MIADTELASRGARLFQFLAQAQVVRSRPVRDVQDYGRSAAGGQVHWISDAPRHEAVSCAHRETADTVGGFLLSVDRLIREAPPEVPWEIVPWLKGDPDKATVTPELVDRKPEGKRFDFSTQREVETHAELVDHPEITAAYERWMSKWRPWAEREKRDAPVREYYADLFGTFIKAGSHSEDLELVLGVGLLVWRPSDVHPRVRRHVFTSPVIATMDDRTGRLTFRLDEAAIGLTAELEMIDPSALPRSETAQEARVQGERHEGHPFDADSFADLASTVVNSLGPEGAYVGEAAIPTAAANPVIGWSPALLLRPRTNAGLIRIFNKIAARIEDSGSVPAGLRTLVDPDQPPQAEADAAPGALHVVDGETFSPLPLNTVQRDIINRVDSHAQTLVKGPPGTGKTHTAAALLSHLLAQGKRVLVTAHTDRALEEVRGKLPKGIQPLAVSVIGASRAELTDLKTAVETISHRAQTFNRQGNDQEIARAINRLDDLGNRRRGLSAALLTAREAEVLPRRHSTYSGTLSTIAQALAAEQEQYKWISPYLGILATGESPLADEEALRWLGLLRNGSLDADEAESRLRLISLEQIPTPESFLALLTQQRSASDVRSAHSELLTHEAAQHIQAMPASGRHDLQKRMRNIIQMVERLEQSRQGWVRDALTDIRSGTPQVWGNRASSVRALLARLAALTDRVPIGTDVSYSGDIGALTSLAEHVLAFLSGGGSIKSNPDGTVKFGLLTSGAVKQSRLLFESVRVNRRPPVTSDALEIFLAHVEADGILAQLDKAWPASVSIPEEDTIGERSAWHLDQVTQLERVLQLGSVLMAEEESLAGTGLARPDWTDLQQVLDYAHLVDAAAADEAWRSASEPIEALISLLDAVTKWSDAAPCVAALREAVVNADHGAYAASRGRIARLHDVVAALQERHELGDRLRRAATPLVEAVERDVHNDAWLGRLGALTASWNWATTRTWLIAQDSIDVNEIQAQLTALEAEIHGCVATIAQHRAWSHAVSPERLPASARAELVHYSQLVKKLGKGTGKHAAEIRADIRRSMDRCRSSVPVWIMPIYRIAEQLQAEEDMFDVVLVDEASQAGHEATFLQYLAKKIVVIGDDMQVSPSAVGVDTESLLRLADQYIPDHPHKGTWCNPKQSFFDEAVKRYGGQLTLVEHRRCVPEIIEFSNQVAYRPNNVELIPVRQFGADRLEPIKAVHLPEAREEGSSGSKINRGEARAIVDRIKTLIDDPDYDDLTFGVISLVGARQAKRIETLLLAEVPAEEWGKRDLRVGDAADFQGSERDVMFLSMVSSTGEDIRLASLTTDTYLQRFNVAVSRAKDQLWLFHSITQGELKNKEDMRYQLLDYCYTVVNSGPDLELVPSDLVSETALEPRFGSIFQQRVYNRIAACGFTVIPNYRSNQDLIDLVVVGALARLALECQGDSWLGDDAYARDLARQRELQRCGWRFFRVRESAFYLDEESALAGLWALLDELRIRPFDPTATAVVEVDAHADGDPATGAGSAGQVLGMNEEPASWEDGSSLTDDDARIDTIEPMERESAGFRIMVEIAEPEREPFQPEPQSPTDWSLFDNDNDRDDNGEGDHENDEDEEEEEEPRRGDVLPYSAFSGSVPALTGSSVASIHEGLIEVVRIEGPVTGQRLHAAYADACGIDRPSKAGIQVLNQAIARAVRARELVEDDPLKEGGVKPKTYRLPQQPLVRVRRLGPRVYAEVPPREVAELLRIADMRSDWDSRGELFRNAVRLLDRRTLTDDARTAFERVYELAFHEHEHDHDAEATTALRDVRPQPEVRAAVELGSTLGRSSVVSAPPLAERPASWRRYGRERDEWIDLVDAAHAVLIETARREGVLTYTDLNNRLVEETGIRTFDLRTDVGRHGLGSILDDVTRLSFPESGVMISSLVTLKGHADVGHGFYALAQKLGLLAKDASPFDKEAFWVLQVSATHQRYAS